MSENYGLIPFSRIVNHQSNKNTHAQNYLVSVRVKETVLFLDAEDILDDDVIALSDLKLRLMMDENTVSVTPKTVTSKIKNFFYGNKDQSFSATTPKIRSSDEIESFRDYLTTNKNVLDCLNIIMLLEGCNKIQLPLRTLLSWSIILEAMTRRSTLLTSSIIYRGLSAFKFLNLEDPNVKTYLHLLWLRIEESSVLLDSTDVCPAIYCLHTVETFSVDIKRIISYLALSLSRVTDSEDIPNKFLTSAVFGLKKLKPIPEVRNLVLELAYRIEQSSSYFHPVNVCIALNGFQSMDDSHPEVRKLMNALIDKAISAEEQGEDRAEDREISMALFGLQKMGISNRKSHESIPYSNEDSLLVVPEKGDTKQTKSWVSSRSSFSGSTLSVELRKVLVYLASLLNHTKKPFEAKRLGFAMMGLSRLSSDSMEVKLLLRSLQNHTSFDDGPINGQEISMCLHGLKSMHSDSIEVQQFIRNLTPLIQRCPHISRSDARSALFGMQGLHTTSKETIMLCDAFGDLLNRSTIVLTRADEASSILFGLQGMNAEIPQVKKVMRAVNNMILTLPPATKFDGKDISMSLYGLRGSSTGSEILNIMECITPFVRNFHGYFTAQEVANCFYGLQKIKTGPKQVNLLVDSLGEQIINSNGILNPKGVSMTLNGLQGFNSKLPQVEKLLNSLCVVLEKTASSFHGFDDFFQISSAIYGLCDCSTDSPAVRELLIIIADLLSRGGPENNNRGIRQSKLAANGSTSIISQNFKRYDKGRTFDLPKTEKVAMALFAMQGLSSEYQSVQDIMNILLYYIDLMPNADGRVVGMVFQAFKSCNGSLPTSHETAMRLLGGKISGWSLRKVSRGFSSKSSPHKLTQDEVEVTLRSALIGLAGLQKENVVVQEILVNFAHEIVYNIHEKSMINISSFNQRTKQIINKVFISHDSSLSWISDDKNGKELVSKMLLLMNVHTFTNENSQLNNQVPLWKKADIKQPALRVSISEISL
eukprot:gene5889-8124_t